MCVICMHTQWAVLHVPAMNKVSTVIYGHYDCFLSIHARTADQAGYIHSKSPVLPLFCIRYQLQKFNRLTG